ncbi:MAG: lysozyme inhibitor LprI family protein [Janthinobacterium lividum]
MQRCRLYGILTIGLASSALFHPAIAAEKWVADHNQCNNRTSTIDITSCINARTEIWDQRLNQAYKALTAMLAEEPSTKNRVAPLQSAQRAWVKYRDANRAYYNAQEGTIRSVDVSQSMQRMTQDRAIELQGEGPQ